MLETFLSVFSVIILFSLVILAVYYAYFKKCEKFIISLGEPQKVFEVSGKSFWLSNKEYPTYIKFYKEHLVIDCKKKKYFHFDYVSSLETKEKNNTRWYVLYWSTNFGNERLYFKTEQIDKITEMLKETCSLVKIKILPNPLSKL